jgi:hypothetical protein
VPPPSVRDLSRQWADYLAPYRRHRNDEHREALVEEAARYVGFRLEDDLSGSNYWSKAPLARRVAVLLFLVDRRVVVRAVQEGQVIYEPTFDAEAWVSAQPALVPYLAPTLELIAALRHEQARRIRPSHS